ncbi:hypothetical protein [Aquella oligotrophica]|uniref:Uncharacterized protein n=1 Tax=Aquella oligotrophica TaxID=2067065 RepID=A0A2I7N3I4_9NEIS|nr:hypothetical protein [Aquella oligotrophica]AUR51020.1 hypothetical protein CUN60_01435 [Aquella oligotrophica]
MKKFAQITILLTSVLTLVACNNNVGNQGFNQQNHPMTTDTIAAVESTPATPTPVVPAGFETDAASCTANGGKLLVGVVTDTPWYESSNDIMQGVELSHTHILVLPLAEAGSKSLYDIAADNVFATGYDQAQPLQEVPNPLNTLTPGTTIEACGITYTQTPNAQSPASQGIHFVHINNNPIVPGKTDNGWLKIVNNNGTLSDNLEANPEYLYLWN